MSYYIDIINTTSPLTQVVVENASASGISLSWNGGDAKDTMTVVSSELKFDMLTKTAEDAAFVSFFTGDENKYNVLIKNSTDDSVVWQGYILPDLYSEPYKNGCFFVSFTAVCGLSRLKGKYLPDEYYSREKSIIDIYCQILKLTGLELDLYFNPAIENFINKDWDAIYIDTTNFTTDKGKKQDAYKILETLLADMLCVCYQCDNRWYIEGINTRHIRTIEYKKYSTEGVYDSVVSYTRLLKQITPLPTPTITMIPPYNEIKISHKKIEPKLPVTISKEANDGWAIVTGVLGQIHASSWMANGDYFARCKHPDYYCVFYNQDYNLGLSGTTDYAQDDDLFISLREKVFISRTQKLKFQFNFRVKKPGQTTANPSNMLLWKNPFKYEILFNDVVIFSNFNGIVSDTENVIFDDNGTAKIAIEHIFMADGLLDIRFYAPTGVMNTNKIEGVIIEKCDISVIGFNEEEVVSDLINGEFTIDKEIDLSYGDDKSGVSNSFRLAKLKEATTAFNEIEVPILYGFALNGKNYSVVTLEGANLIQENIYNIYRTSVLIPVIGVFYNFNNGEQMVICTETLYTSGSFFVKKYAIDDVVASRTHWTQWTDAIYKIENTTYSKTVANIYRRMFNAAHEKLDLEALNAVKFNDLIVFKYVYEKNFFVLNSTWNLDTNKSNLTLSRCYYKDSGTSTEDGNVPPIVIAGDDIYIADAVTTASVVATAYDPDGYVLTKSWTKLLGGVGDVIATPSDLATDFDNLTDDFYTYQIEVTDNQGATAVDTLNIIRNKTYTITLDVVSTTDNSADTDNPSIVTRYALNVSPVIPDNFILTLYGAVSALISVQSYANGYDAFMGYVIEKNGVNIEPVDIVPVTSTIPIVLNFIATDEIYFDLTVDAQKGIDNPGDYASVTGKININSTVITTGVGTIAGLPTEVVLTVGVTSGT
jgi:hypothetical protein